MALEFKVPQSLLPLALPAVLHGQNLGPEVIFFLLAEFQLQQLLDEALVQPFLPHGLGRAVAAMAAVVNMTFLPLGNHGVAAEAAAHKLAKEEVVVPDSAVDLAPKQLLHPVKQDCRHDRLVAAGKSLL